ncbi:hypothetical protein LCGC14_2899180 [marine sediment metagenome]|uniref:Uncharacterized protein n=1 Tax=marine sediment metagenome TaxID=412755 RepID=A0A0F8XVD7_9ZZZZ
MSDISLDCLTKKDIGIITNVMEFGVEMLMDFEEDVSCYKFPTVEIKATLDKIKSFHNKMEKKNDAG